MLFVYKMKKRNTLFILFLLFFLSSKASPTDSISTVYKNGEFVSYCHVSTNSSDSVSTEVINKFVNQMCYDLDGLFKWGLKGMHLVNEKDELLTFDFRSTHFNPKTSILRGTGDVIVTGITKIPNIHIDSRLSEKTHANGRRDVRLDLASPNSLLKKMVGVFSYVPQGKGKTGYYVLEAHIQFGWFFNVFITKNKYKKIMEWRLRQVVRNLKEESEKRGRYLASSKQ